LAATIEIRRAQASVYEKSADRKEDGVFGNLLTKLLERVAEEMGGKAASLILDEKARSKRTSMELYRSLRNLEEVLREAEQRLEHAFLRGWSEDKGDYEELNRLVITQDFVARFAMSLDEAQQAFKKIDDKIEIYRSRDEMEELHGLLGGDAEVMYLLHDDYNMTRLSTTQWKTLIKDTRLAAKKARDLVSTFIRDKFPM
jgi:hypothetical protein